jgi:hypothetical protein
LFAKGSEVDAVSDSIKAISNAALTYTDEAPSLKVAPTETNVGYSYVSSNNSIVLTLNESPAKLEGCTINFTVRNVERRQRQYLRTYSLVGLYVNQNQTEVGEQRHKRQTARIWRRTTFTATITNKGASTENWTLSNSAQLAYCRRESNGSLPALTEQDAHLHGELLDPDRQV